jgi:GR25 family glycosyltransferase involved in LPS biosynthesis
MPLTCFDAIVYINLDHRKDRKKALLKELLEKGASKDSIHRIPAVYDDLNGHRGCVQSHMQALALAKKNGWKKTLILEDDCHFDVDNETMKKELRSFFQKINNWDVLFLGTHVFTHKTTPYPGIYQITKSLCAHAYAIHYPYIDKLYNCYQVSYQLMQDHLLEIQSTRVALDRVWQILQKEDRWYLTKNMAQQCPSTSDITKGFRKRYFSEIDC